MRPASSAPTQLVRRWWDGLPEADKAILTASALIGVVVLIAVVLALPRMS